MTILENVSEGLQIKILLISLIIGICFELIFEINHQLFSIASKKNKKIVSIIFDTLFVFEFTIFTHAYMLAFSFGKIRFFIILGELIGFIIGYITIGRLFRKLLNFIHLLFIKNLYKNLKTFFMRIFHRYCAIVSKFKHFFKKPQKVVKKT